MRRQATPFNLSLLDLLTAALGAVIFLFVITPKGGAGAAATQQASLFFDTASMQIHGTLPDSLLAKRTGDTLFAMLVDFRPVPGEDATALAAELAAEKRRAAAAEQERQRALLASETARTERQRAEAARRVAEAERKAADAKRRAAEARVAAAKPPAPTRTTTPARPAPPTAATPAPKPKRDDAYRGTPPSVPARVSFELTWADKTDNVDLFVCQGNNCVYGNRKRDKAIGQWDSGKSRNRLFGNDLRTNQEAVRQFDDLLPGTYTVYAMFKESERNRASVKVEGLVYTKDDAGKPRGQTYSRTLKRGDSRTRLITVTIKPDGTFTTR